MLDMGGSNNPELILLEPKSMLNGAAANDVQEAHPQVISHVDVLNARIERMERDAYACAVREAALIHELDKTRRALAAAAAAAIAATSSRRHAPLPGFCLHVDATRPPVSYPLWNSITQELEAAVRQMESVNGPIAWSSTCEASDLAPFQAALVTTLTKVVVLERLPCIDALSGPGGTLVVPLAAWLLHKCLLQWAREWRPVELAAAVQHIEASISNVAIADRGLRCAGYWLAASLATGALIKVQVVRKPEMHFLFKLADAFIGMTELHIALGCVIAEEIPVDVALLLSEEAMWAVSSEERDQDSTLAPTCNSDPTDSSLGDSSGFPSAEDLVDPDPMDAAGPHWRSILNCMSTIVEVLKEQGVPAPAVRAVVWATLRYIDGELLNALLLRRDCCSVSAARALLTGLGVLTNISRFLGTEWACEPEEADRALRRSYQAAHYLLQGKNECALKSQRSIDVLPDLNRHCGALTLDQLYRLTEYQHYDTESLYDTGCATNQILLLLASLRVIMRENRKILDSARMYGSSTTDHHRRSFDEEESSTELRSEIFEIEEEDLLVDSLAAFAMFDSQNVFTRKLLTEGAKSFVPPGPAAALFTSPSSQVSTEHGRNGAVHHSSTVPKLNGLGIQRDQFRHTSSQETLVKGNRQSSFCQ